MSTPASALMPNYSHSDVVFERGEGAWLYTAEGEAYLDFTSGIAVNTLGHADPRLAQALKDQTDKLWHTSNIFRIPGQERLAERLTAHSFADRAFFCNSGAEAIECGLKAIRRYHYKQDRPGVFRVITFEGAFHGRTLATIAAGGNPSYTEGFEPSLDGFDQVPFGDLAAVKKAIGPTTAGILIEPIQGEGGVQPAPEGFLQGLRDLCDQEGLLLMFDEVQCGIARTGRLFAYEWDGVTPDIMALAKGLGGGFPLGACVMTEAVAQYMTPGTHGSTFGGNPLAMAVGNAVLDVITEDGFLDHVRRVGSHVQQKLAALQDRFSDRVAEIRGRGLMVGVRLTDAVSNLDVMTAAQDERLLLPRAGNNIVRFFPPLNVDMDTVDDAVARLERALEKIEVKAAD